MTGIIGKIPSRSKIVESLATVEQGGTGVATFTDGGVLLGSGTGAITATAALADGEMLVGDGTTDPAIESGATLRTSIGLGNVTNESKATMFSSPTFTGNAVLGTPASGTLTNCTFPAGHIVAYKTGIYSSDGSNYLDCGSASTWVGTSSELNLTHSMNNSSNMLIFTITASNMYLSGSRELFVAVGLTSDLTGDDANIIRYASEGPGGDDAKGKSAIIGVTALTGLSCTWTYKYLPATTSERIYQPIHHGDGSTDSHLSTNNDIGFVFFSLTEVVI